MFPRPALAEKLHSFLYRTHIRKIKPVLKASPETTNTNSERIKN